MNNLELLQKEFPKLTWYQDTINTYKGISGLITIEFYKTNIENDQEAWWIDIYFTNEEMSDSYGIDLLFESQVWNYLDLAIEGTKRFIREVSKTIQDLI